MSNGIRIEYLLDVFLAGSKLTRLRVCLSSLRHPRLTDFAKDVSDEKTNWVGTGRLAENNRIGVLVFK